MERYTAIKRLTELSRKRKEANLNSDWRVPDPDLEAIDFAIAYMKGVEPE